MEDHLPNFQAREKRVLLVNEYSVKSYIRMFDNSNNSNLNVALEFELCLTPLVHFNTHCISDGVVRKTRTKGRNDEICFDFFRMF